MSPGRRQAIIWTNVGILLIRLLVTNFCEILIELLTFSFKKMCLKVSSATWRPFSLGLNVLKYAGSINPPERVTIGLDNRLSHVWALIASMLTYGSSEKSSKENESTHVHFPNLQHLELWITTLNIYMINEIHHNDNPCMFHEFTK